LRKTPILSQKIAENCDHNIDPRIFSSTHEDVLEAAEEAVDVGLAVLVVTDVEHEHQRDANLK
jgi:hypothetical protein